MAEVVRTADGNPLTRSGRATARVKRRPALSRPHPAGEGLRWIASGFALLGLSDHEILEREFPVYDALYQECRRRSSEGPNCR